jgi:pyruvate dehydrogenase E2 component (dihydrolipoamide acetyltransferase)
MIQSFAFTAQVTHFQEIDVTNLVKKREIMKPESESKNIKLTFLAFILEALIKTLNEFPKFNASYDHINQNLIIKQYINLGIAVDTENGLMVPVIKNAEKLDIWELATGITDLAEKAKNKKIELADLKDSTITITNFGSIGGKFATPILNYPNLANIGIGKFENQLHMNENGQIETKTICPLSITYDHQIIDGAETARFTNYLAKILNSFA